MAARDTQAVLAELAEWAAGRGATPVTHRYGSGSEQVADLWLPGGPGPHRPVVLIHGGFWRAEFTRASMTALAVDLAQRGWASWNVEYRRIGNGGGVPETLNDIRAAIEALSGYGAGLDLRRLLVIGHSAGGQLALWATGLVGVSAVVALAGVCDLDRAARRRIGDGAAIEFTGGTPRRRPEAYALADPRRRLPARLPVLLVHGDADDRVPVEQSRRYERAARAAGDRCQLLELAGVDHFSLIDPRTAAWARVAEQLDDL